MDQAKLISLYLSQGDHYHSDTAGDMIKIAGMHPYHAANAARSLLLLATQWSDDAGRKDLSRELSRGGNTAAWMLGTPLFRALQARATKGSPDRKLDLRIL